jgi:hypothetical protein
MKQRCLGDLESTVFLVPRASDLVVVGFVDAGCNPALP